ncbi:MAG TPA: PilZ domain-containing protein [Candidatus Bathyarchaeia archaeon]|jgi:hypothetical protein|nr:PilZ domain-containing protein [Candidatus Bathyarchaeia archaeon]
MSERTQSAENKTPSASSGPIPERRRIRRAGVSLQVRVRPLYLSDGNFEEVRTTLNASRMGFFFVTPLDRYHKGMRLRITSAYGSFAGPGNWEDTGQVIRVQRRAGGFGVAVLLASSNHLAMPGRGQQPSEKQNSRDSDRRSDLRCSFQAPVELIDIRTGSRMLARISDLSMRGCYVDTLNPFPIDAAVRLRIQKGNEILDVTANVASRHTGSGMGMVFDTLTTAQRSVLESWLCESFASPESDSLSSESRSLLASMPEKKAQPELLDVSCVARLVQTLVHKGVLSQSEASDILGDLDD